MESIAFCILSLSGSFFLIISKVVLSSTYLNKGRLGCRSFMSDKNPSMPNMAPCGIAPFICTMLEN